MSELLSSDERAVIAQRAACESLVEQANLHHKAACDAADFAANSILQAINHSRECGIYLARLKSESGSGGWMSIFPETANAKSIWRLNFSRETARLHMRLADAYPEPITTLPEAVKCLTDMWIACGALSAPHRDERQHASSVGPIARFTKAFMSAFAILGKERRKLAIDQWPNDRRLAVKEQLRPAVELYQQL